MSVKTMNKNLMMMVILIGLITSTGCILNTLNDSGNMMTANGSPKKSSNPDPKITPTIQPIPLLSETPLITPTPTLDYLFMPEKGPSFEQQARLFEVLKDSNCELPCYLGITPGQTTWQEAKLKLESYGNVFYGPDRSEKSLAYDFRMVFLGSHVIILNIEDNIVQRIFLSIINHDESMYYDNWSKYSIHHTLIQLGAPDDIFINANEDRGYSIAMVYKKSGMALEWYGTQKEKGEICPAFKSGDTYGLNFSITNPDSSLGIFGSRKEAITPYDREVWTPLEEKTGINKEAFYNLFKTDPDACIKVKL